MDLDKTTFNFSPPIDNLRIYCISTRYGNTSPDFIRVKMVDSQKNLVQSSSAEILSDYNVSGGKDIIPLPPSHKASAGQVGRISALLIRLIKIPQAKVRELQFGNFKILPGYIKSGFLRLLVLAILVQAYPSPYSLRAIFHR